MSDVMFSYKGRIYNRPLSRGLVLVDDDDKHIEDVLPEGDLGNVEIIIRKLPAASEPV